MSAIVDPILGKARWNDLNPTFETIGLDTTYSPTGSEVTGTTYWDDTNRTISTVLENGTILQHGQELPEPAYNDTGVDIDNGVPVYINGRHGHEATIALARSDSDTTGTVFGLTTSPFGSTGDAREGYVTSSGLVRGVKTNYTGSGNWGTTWAVGDRLYISKTVAGQLTNVEPAVPHHSDIVGTVAIVGAVGTGAIDVKIIRHKTLEELSNVDGANPDATGDLLSWNQTSGSWERNAYNIGDYYTETEADNRFVNVTGDTMTGDLVVDAQLDVHGQTSISLTGTATVTSGANTVVGTGTLFTTEITVGDYMLLGGTQGRVVTSISSDTSLTVDTGWGSNATDVSIAKYRPVSVGRDYEGNPISILNWNGRLDVIGRTSGMTNNLSANAAMLVRSAGPAGGIIISQATSSTAYSGMNLFDETGTLSGSFAYGNSAATFYRNEFVISSRKASTNLVFYQGGAVLANERIRLNETEDIIFEKDTTVLSSTTLGSEILTNGALTSGTGWTATGDVTLATNRANFSFSTGTGTIQQIVFAVTPTPNRWYSLTYTPSSFSTFIGTLSLGTGFAASATSLRIGSGVQTVYFKAASTITDFTITFTGTAGTMILDTLSLKEVQSGNMEVMGVVSGGGTSGLKVDQGGNVGIGTTLPASLLDVTSATGGVFTLRRLDTSITADDSIGTIQFYAADTSTTSNFIVANIEAQATNTISTDINPGRLIFRTTPTGVAATPTEAMRITETQTVVVNEDGVATQDFRVESDTEANMLFVDANADTDGAIYLGGTTNGIKINKGGEILLIGTATRWNDLRVEPAARGTSTVNTPSFNVYKTNTGLYDFDDANIANEKEVFFTVQMPHDWKEGSTIYPHVHWVNRTTGTAGHVVKWDLYWTKATIGGTFGATSTNSGTTIVGGGDITVADEHMITTLGTITMTDDKISTVIICKLRRNSSDATDTYTGTAGLLYVDFHYEVDTIGGSAEEFTK